MPLLDPTTFDWLLTMMYNINPYVKVFKMVRDMMVTKGVPIDLKLPLIAFRTKDAHRYNVPMANEITTLMVGDGSEVVDRCDVIIAKQVGSFHFSAFWSYMWDTWLYIIRCYFLMVRMDGMRIFRSMVFFCKMLMQIWMKTMLKNLSIIESITM
jgi:hypothetical protein